MKCQKCGKHNATTHITEILNGKKSEIFLCPTCAQFAGGTPFTFHSFDSDFTNLFASLWTDQNLKTSPFDLSCPNCKTTLYEIQKTGRFVCSECYPTFFDYIKKSLKEIHGFVKHSGKSPKKISSELVEPNRLGKLKSQLKKAVDVQNFEEAAVLRDRIKELENSTEEV